MLTRFSVGIALALVMTRCGVPTVIIPVLDSGTVTPVDSGTPVVDAAVPDSGAPSDSGIADAGPVDAGIVDAGPTAAQLQDLAVRLDAYIDQRMTAPAGATDQLISRIHAINADISDVERLLRRGRASYPVTPQPAGVVTQELPVTCYSVNYTSVYDIYVPRSYLPKVAVPLVIVGHGGNSSMSAEYARSTALSYLNAYKSALGDTLGAIVVAPATERGWSPIGDSLIFTVMSKVQREYHIDPDRIYVIGQSMGGHLAWRDAINFTDRWAGVSPQSGGYDSYVTTHQIENIYGLAGYGTWGTTEPYGLTQTNIVLKTWLDAYHFPWTMMQKPGGHEIYADEQPKIAALFKTLKRNIHSPGVYFRQAGAMKYLINWAGQTDTVFPEKTFRWNRKRWIEVTPRPESADELAVWAEVKANNVIEVTSDKVRQLRVYLHPDMGLDFSHPIHISVNGVTMYNAMAPADDLKQLLETVREFDDRGRIARSFVELNITTDSPVGPHGY